MARNLGDMKYFYYDKCGTKYRPTTNDSDEGLALDGMSGEELRYVVQDGGDCTVTSANKFTKSVKGL
jgi:hypothetical protein